MKAINRLFEYIDRMQLKPTRLEKEIGLSNGYLRTQERRNADLGEGVLLKILDYCLDLNPVWLLTGKGEMLKPQSPKPEGNLGQVSDPDSSKIIGELTEVIRTQAKALLEQQQFINAHFSRNGMDSVTPPLTKGGQSADK